MLYNFKLENEAEATGLLERVKEKIGDQKSVDMKPEVTEGI